MDNDEIKAPAATGNHADSGMFDPVIKKDYAEKSLGDLDTPTPEAPPSRVLTGKKMVIEDDPAFEEINKPPAPDPVPLFSETGIDIGNSNQSAAEQMVSSGMTSTSDFVYENLEFLVPEACHHYSKIDLSKITQLSIPKTTADSIVSKLEAHNERSLAKFRWNRLHETNIKKPLKALLVEKGMEETISPAIMLLIGVIVIGIMTYSTFKNVKKENDAMLERILKELRAIHPGAGKEGD